jgi:exonuclease III
MINMRKIDIMGFSETKLTHKQAPHVFNALPNYRAIFHSHQNHTNGSGVGLLIHNDYARFIHRIRYFSDRVIAVDLLMKGKGGLRIIQLYTPTASNNLVLRKSVDKFVLDLELRKMTRINSHFDSHNCKFSFNYILT